MKFFKRFLGDDEAEPESPLDTERSSLPSPAPEPASAAAGPAPSWDFGSLTAPPAPAAAAGASIEVDQAATDELKPRVIEALKTVFDPEIPVDIYELGLIYGITASADRRVHVSMTLTSPACPSAQQLPSEVQYKVKAVEGVTDATVDVVWEPPWDKDRMSETAKLSLGFF